MNSSNKGRVELIKTGYSLMARLPRGVKRGRDSAELRKLGWVVVWLNDEVDWERSRKDTLEDFARLKGLHGPNTQPVPSLEWFREGGTRTSKELQGFVDTWLDAGRDFRVWQERNRESDTVVQRVHTGTRFLLTPCSDGRAADRVRFFAPQPEWPQIAESTIHAARAFADLVQSPLRERVGKCDRCGRYYLSGGSYRKKRFCSRNCASNHSAIASTSKRRKNERQAKLATARRALRSVPLRQKRSGEWKTVVATKAGVTRKWLTRAINKGDLKIKGGEGTE